VQVWWNSKDYRPEWDDEDYDPFILNIVAFLDSLKPDGKHMAGDGEGLGATEVKI
jgi:hypothetical protein